tara:strand:- start:1327 stop:1728 length:402 start_codon:yes stop_codon:yes gene_type:complete
MKVDECRLVAKVPNDKNDFIVFGLLLRRLKLDELPQLLNVIKCDMSFIGPRPCLEATLKCMPKTAFARFNVRPGLSGLAQVRGNTGLSWENRWRYDILYAKRVSFLLDFKITFKTLVVICLGEKQFLKIKQQK